DLADHHCKLLSSLTIRAEFLCSEPDSGRSSLPQRAFLLAAQHPGSQPPAASIREQPKEPRPKVVSDEHHASSVPVSFDCVSGSWSKPATARRASAKRHFGHLHYRTAFPWHRALSSGSKTHPPALPRCRFR